MKLTATRRIALAAVIVVVITTAMVLTVRGRLSRGAGVEAFSYENGGNDNVLTPVGMLAADPTTCVHPGSGFAFSSEMLLKNANDPTGSSCLVNNTGLGLIADVSSCAPSADLTGWKNLLAPANCKGDPKCAATVAQGDGGPILRPATTRWGANTCQISFNHQATAAQLGAFDAELQQNAINLKEYGLNLKELKAEADLADLQKKYDKLLGQYEVDEAELAADAAAAAAAAAKAKALASTTTTLYLGADRTGQSWSPSKVGVIFKDLSDAGGVAALDPAGSTAFNDRTASVFVPAGQTFEGHQDPGLKGGAWIVVGPSSQNAPGGWWNNGLSSFVVKATGTATGTPTTTTLYTGVDQTGDWWAPRVVGADNNLPSVYDLSDPKVTTMDPTADTGTFYEKVASVYVPAGQTFVGYRGGGLTGWTWTVVGPKVDRPPAVWNNGVASFTLQKTGNPTTTTLYKGVDQTGLFWAPKNTEGQMYDFNDPGADGNASDSTTDVSFRASTWSVFVPAGKIFVGSKEPDLGGEYCWVVVGPKVENSPNWLTLTTFKIMTTPTTTTLYKGHNLVGDAWAPGNLNTLYADLSSPTGDVDTSFNDHVWSVYVPQGQSFQAWQDPNMGGGWWQPSGPGMIAAPGWMWQNNVSSFKITASKASNKKTK